MKNIIIFFLFFSAFYLKAQTPNFAWVNGCTSSGVDMVHVAVDNERGALYTTGSFDFGRIKFSGSFDLPSMNSGKSMFLAKYTTAGALVWAKVFAGPNKDCMANGIAVDKTSGNVYVAGNTGSNNGSIRKVDTIHFGTQLFIDHNWVENAFLVKIDPNGNPLWVRGGLGPNDSSLAIANAVAIDSVGNPYITGTFFNKVQFGAFLLNRADHWDDIFVVKYDKNGNEIFAKQSIGSGYHSSSGSAINIDKLGNILVTGTANADPNPGFPERDLIKYDNNGAFQWIKRDGIWQSGTFGTSVSTDNNNNIYISGIKAIATVSSVNTAYKNNYYITKFNTAGDSLWSVLLDSSVHAGIDFRTVADAGGNVYALFYIFGYTTYSYTIGTYTNSLNFNSLFGLGMITTVIKYNTSGTVVWGKSTMTNSGQFSMNFCQGWDLCLDQVGNIYIGGRLSDTAYYDNLKAYGGSPGSYGLYTAKLGFNAGGINNITNGEEEFSLWPNPASDNVYIDYHGTERAKINFRIIDVNGKEVLQQNISERKTVINLQNISNGIYFVQLSDGMKRMKYKLVVTH